MDNAYRCENEHCTLGSRKDPGRFTGGITAEQAVMLNGDPDAQHGEAVCPNCGGPGVPDGEHESHQGHDPLDHLHQEIAGRVADPGDPLSAPDAYAALVALADDQEED